jgi:hypothetical protein
MHLYSHRRRFFQHTDMNTWVNVSLSSNLGNLLLIVVYYALKFQSIYLLHVTVLADGFPFASGKFLTLYHPALTTPCHLVVTRQTAIFKNTSNGT